jgi:polar amino acid transport system permease protein
LLDGLALTVKLTLASAIAGIALGFVASLLRTYGPGSARAIATGYVEVFRGTPLLVQLFWFFFCLPLLLGGLKSELQHLPRIRCRNVRKNFLPTTAA